jgi:hypothetical protein
VFGIEHLGRRGYAVPKKQNVPPAVKEAIRGRLKDPQLAEVAAHFFAQAGGPREVAKMLFLEFTKAKEGSVVRQRILDMILRVTRFANEKNAPRDDMGMLSEEDLASEFELAMAELPKEAFDAAAESAEAVSGPGPAVHDPGATAAAAASGGVADPGPAADDPAAAL